MFIAVLLTFLAVFLLVSSLFFVVTTVKESPSHILKMRLRKFAYVKDNKSLPENIRNGILKEIPPLEQYLQKISLYRNLDRKLMQAGLKIQPHNFILYAATTVIVSSSGMFLYCHKIYFAFLTGTIILLIISVTMHYLKVRREEKLTEQLPDMLMIVARSLRAGHSLTSAIELVGLETPDPTGELFKIAYEQQKLGLRVSDTLGNMTDRIESLDLRFFITTVTINSEIGGNLSETLDKLAETIRQRLQVRRQIQVYTAQGRFSGYVLGALPIVMFIAFNIMNPQYEQVLFQEKIGNYLLIGAVSMQIVGFIVIRKITNIRI